MSETYQITGRQIAAARTLAGMGQEELAKRANISVPTLRRMEASEGVASGLPNNVAAVRVALESAGVEFTNGGQPGVRLKMREDTNADLKQQINHMQSRVDFDEPTGPATPKRGMQQLRGAKAKNELVKLKNRRTKLKGKK
jgi:transcriptional regulator with XRE-family HTH domain